MGTDRDGVRVRPLAPDDEAAWLPLWQGYHTFYKNTPGDDVTRTTWSRFFDPAEPVHARVAEQTGRLVGLVHYLFHRNTWMVGPVCYLQDLFTAPEARGQGVASRLIESVYAEAAGAGASRVYWLTHETNTVAQALYDRIAERSGFIVYRKTVG